MSPPNPDAKKSSYELTNTNTGNATTRKNTLRWENVGFEVEVGMVGAMLRGTTQGK